MWKLADVPPLLNVPAICDFIKDLSLVSLASTLSKVAEGIVIEKELKLTTLSTVAPGQFGFIPGSSTTFAINPIQTWGEGLFEPPLRQNRDNFYTERAMTFKFSDFS